MSLEDEIARLEGDIDLQQQFTEKHKELQNIALEQIVRAMQYMTQEEAQRTVPDAFRRAHDEDGEIARCNKRLEELIAERDRLTEKKRTPHC